MNGRHIFLKNGLYYVLCGSLVIILGQAAFLVVSNVVGHTVFELRSSSHWLSIFDTSDNDRVTALFMYQPMLFVGLTLMYACLRCARLFGYHQVFFAALGGILNAGLVMLLLVGLCDKARVSLSEFTFVTSAFWGFVSGFLFAPVFLRKGIREEEEEENKPVQQNQVKPELSHSK